MKRLILLRHARSGYGTSDQSRPLAKRGRREAFWLGQYLNTNNLLPDYILCSSADRATESLNQLLTGAETAIPESIRDDLYLASAEYMTRQIQSLESDVTAAMIIGHNPGLASLFQNLTGNSAKNGVNPAYRTCSAGILDFDINDWSDLKSKSGQVFEFIIPSDRIGH